MPHDFKGESKNITAWPNLAPLKSACWSKGKMKDTQQGQRVSTTDRQKQQPHFVHIGRVSISACVWHGEDGIHEGGPKRTRLGLLALECFGCGKSPCCDVELVDMPHFT